MNDKKYRIVAIIVSISLFAAVIEDSTIESKAFVMETAVAFELLQAVFMSVGITVVSYDALTRLFSADGKEARFNDIIDGLNTYDEGLGTRLELVIYAANLTGSGWSVSMDDDTFRRLKALSDAIANGYEFTMGSEDEVQFISDPDQLISVSTIAVGNMMVDYGTQYHVSDMSLKWDNWAEENFNDFIQAIDNNYAAISSILNYKTNNKGMVNAAQMIYFAAKDGQPVAGAAIVREDGKAYLRCYDSAGMMVDIVATRSAGWLNTKQWHGFDNVRTGKSVELWLDYGKDQMTMLDAVVSMPNKTMINPEVKNAIESGVYDVVTPGRILTDVGSLAGNIVITIPHSLDLEHELNGVISGVFPLTDVLPKIGVYPVDIAQDKAIANDKTIAETIADADAAAAAVPSVGQYDLGLANFFPFCLPFDFANFIGIFAADPVAPSFTIKLPTGYDGVTVTWTEYEISLSQFDDVAYWVRKMELLAFCVGLLMLTRQVFIRA